MDVATAAEVVSALGTLGAVVTAVWFGTRALRQASAEAAERNRPMVVAELRVGVLRGAVVWFVLRNNGPVIARNVRVTFHPDLPPPPAGVDPSDWKATRVRRRFVAPDGSPRIIPTLSPGQELTQDYVRVGEMNSMPDVIRATVQCRGPDGREWPADEFALDLTVLPETPAASSASVLGRLTQIARTLEQLEGHVAAMAQAPRDGETGS